MFAWPSNKPELNIFILKWASPGSPLLQLAYKPNAKHYKTVVKDLILRPGAATLLMGAAVYALWQFVFTEKLLSAGRLPLLMAVMVCVGAGVVIYAVCALKFGAVKKEDLPARMRRLIWRK